MSRGCAELVEEHVLRCPFVSTVDNIADFFTKCLPKDTFLSMRSRIMNMSEAEATGGSETSADRGSQCVKSPSVKSPVGAGPTPAAEQSMSADRVP